MKIVVAELCDSCGVINSNFQANKFEHLLHKLVFGRVPTVVGLTL